MGGRVSPGALILVALTSLVGAAYVVAPLATSASILLALLLLRRAVGAKARLVALLCALLAAGRAQQRVGEFTQDKDSLYAALGARALCAGDGVVVESPVLRQGNLQLVLETEQLDCERQNLGGRLRMRLVAEPQELARGDSLRFVAELGLVAPLRQVELPDPTPRLAARGILLSGKGLSVERVRAGTGLRAWIDRLRAHARHRILATFSPAAQPMARALTLGENDLDPEDDEAFRQSGLAHLLAVSGTHLVFAVVSLVSGLRALVVRVTSLTKRSDPARITALLGVGLALLYADFAGGSGSAWRAAFMLAAVYLGRALYRHVSGVRALGLSLLVGTLLDPLAVFDLSFLLSGAATAGLLTLGRLGQRLTKAVRWIWLRWVASALLVTLSAMLPCIPLLLLLSPDLNAAGLVANVLAGPVGEIAALPLCLLHVASSPIPSLEQGLALAGSGALLVVRAVAHASAACHWLRVSLPPPTGMHFAVLGVGLVLGICLHISGCGRRGWLAWSVVTLVALVWVEAAARRAGAPQGVLRITVLDVGQGDSLLVDLPDGKLMLIDAGGNITGGPDPGVRVVVPVLRARRRDRIDIVVLTHPHPDHYGGLLGLLPAVDVGEFWESTSQPGPGPVAEVRQLLARRNIKRVTLPELCGIPRHHGGARIDVLWPCPQLEPGTSANDSSLVLRIAHGARVAILPGDAEAPSEATLLQRYGDQLGADFLKLGHHGSRTSSTEAWLRAVHPATAVMSVGLRNRFGHPHPNTLTRLSSLGIPSYRTDQTGSVVWETDGVQVSRRIAAEPRERRRSSRFVVSSHAQ